MKFITEGELRDQYRKSPFTEYVPDANIRLTPGARQFLHDRGIRIPQEEGTENRSWKSSDTAEIKAQSNAGQSDTQKASDDSKEAWRTKLPTIQSFFLEAGLKLLDLDVLIAKEVFDLERILAAAAKGEQLPCSFHSCTGLKEEHCTEYVEDCFEITGFHAQSPKGKEMITLHSLRCRLRELVPELPEKERQAACLVINRLSQMICLAFGGKTCQKQ